MEYKTLTVIPELWSKDSHKVGITSTLSKEGRLQLNNKDPYHRTKGLKILTKKGNLTFKTRQRTSSLLIKVKDSFRLTSSLTINNYISFSFFNNSNKICKRIGRATKASFKMQFNSRNPSQMEEVDLFRLARCLFTRGLRTYSSRLGSHLIHPLRCWVLCQM